MSKLQFYHINNIEIQYWLPGTLKDISCIKNYSIPEDYFDPYLSIVNSSLKKPESDTLFISLVMTSINNGYVVKEEYLLRAYDLVSQKIIKETKMLKEIPLNNNDFATAVKIRKLILEVLKEELGIIKYVLDTKLPYPEKTPLQWAIRFLDDMLLDLPQVPNSFLEAIQARMQSGETFPEIDMDIEDENE